MQVQDKDAQDCCQHLKLEEEGGILPYKSESQHSHADTADLQNCEWISNLLNHPVGYILHQS